MDIIQFIGFLISLLAIIILTVRHMRDERYRRQHPEEYEKEEKDREERLRSFLKSLEGDMEEEKNYVPVQIQEVPRRVPPPKRTKQQKQERPPSKPRPKKPVEQAKYHESVAAKSSRARQLVDGLPNKKLLILLPEIISKPKWRE